LLTASVAASWNKAETRPTTGHGGLISTLESGEKWGYHRYKYLLLGYNAQVELLAQAGALVLRKRSEQKAYPVASQPQRFVRRHFEIPGVGSDYKHTLRVADLSQLIEPGL